MSSKSKPQEITVTIDSSKFKIRHLIEMEELQESNSSAKLLKLVQEITEEDIYDYPVDALPSVIEALMGSIDEISKKKEDNPEGN